MEGSSVFHAILINKSYRKRGKVARSQITTNIKTIPKSPPIKWNCAEGDRNRVAVNIEKM